MDLAKDLTMGECYKPAMEITDPKEATEYLKALIERSVKHYGQTPEEAESIQKQNLGYWAGYYDTETMGRVHKLFSCAHPIFGEVKSQEDLPSPEDAFEMGKKWAEEKKEEE